MTATDTPETFLDIKPSDERDEYEYDTLLMLPDSLKRLFNKGNKSMQSVPDLDRLLALQGPSLLAVSFSRFTRLSVVYSTICEKALPNEELSVQFGRAVAELHVKGEDFSTKQACEVWDAKTLIHRPLAIIEESLQHRKEDLQFL
ncbi:hypothetical protein P4V43_06860 [Brevibacillus fortis]|uniref:hypothetical protein n=1 Tax=Brevibacillus fortis TaxID=2126352 RepID=UPI002E23105E|nr:hypothetical protein [Brevibacillus fortis]